MSNPSNLKYTASHEWVKAEADGTITVGITQHAQELLGDMVFVEAPAAGRKLKAKEECAVVECASGAECRRTKGGQLASHDGVPDRAYLDALVGVPDEPVGQVHEPIRGRKQEDRDHDRPFAPGDSQSVERTRHHARAPSRRTLARHGPRR